MRFIHWSASATSVQQDRLRKCSLATFDTASNWQSNTRKEDNTMTGIGPKAQGKSIKRVVLTGESSYGKVDTHRLGTLSFELDRRTIAERRV